VHALVAASPHYPLAVRYSEYRPGPQAYVRCWLNGMQLTVCAAGTGKIAKPQCAQVFLLFFCK